MPSSARLQGWPVILLLSAVALNLPGTAISAAARLLRARQPIAQPDYTIYHHKDALLKEVADIVAANPTTMQIQKKTSEDKGYKVDMQVVTVEPGGLSSNHSKKARIFIDFGEHGREYISSELGLQLMHTLASADAIRGVLGPGPRGQHVLDMVLNSVFVILPMENTGGRDKVEKGELCERKNGRGVDTNRNWEVDWGKKEPDYNPAEEFPGTAPFSEPEVKIILDIARSLKPHVWLNVHSGMEAMFTPWDHKAEVAPDASHALRILQTIQKDFFTSECVVGSGGKSVGYLAHGTATDYMYERLKVPLPFTWEIYGDMKASFDDCFRMFNPLTKEHVKKVIDLWLKATFRLIELLPHHPAIAAERLFAAANVSAATATPTTASTPTGTGGSQQSDKPAAHAQPSTSSSSATTPSNAAAASSPPVQPRSPPHTQTSQKAAPQNSQSDRTPGGAWQPTSSQPAPQLGAPQAISDPSAPLVLGSPLYQLGHGSGVWVNLAMGGVGLGIIGVLAYRCSWGLGSAAPARSRQQV